MKLRECPPCIYAYVFSNSYSSSYYECLREESLHEGKGIRLSSFSLNLLALCMFLNGIAKFLLISQRFPVLNAPVQVGLVGLW